MSGSGTFLGSCQARSVEAQEGGRAQRHQFNTVSTLRVNQNGIRGDQRDKQRNKHAKIRGWWRETHIAAKRSAHVVANSSHAQKCARGMHSVCSANARSAASVHPSCAAFRRDVVRPACRASNAMRLYPVVRRGSSNCAVSQDESRNMGCIRTTVALSGSKPPTVPVGELVMYHSEA
jgi:hypothetical protein